MTDDPETVRAFCAALALMSFYFALRLFRLRLDLGPPFENRSSYIGSVLMFVGIGCVVVAVAGPATVEWWIAAVIETVSG